MWALVFDGRSRERSEIDVDNLIGSELLKILACPKCKGELRLAEDKGGVICETCRLKYPIEESIPVMLIDRAIPLDRKVS